MASVPSAHLVIFIAAIIVSAAIAGVVIEGAEQLGASLEQSQSDHAKDVATAIQIINDPAMPSATYDESDDILTLYVKNVGGRIIGAEPGEVTVLVNGTAQPVRSVTVHEETRWRPGSVAEVTVDVVLPSNSETRVVVVVSGGRGQFEFTTT